MGKPWYAELESIFGPGLGRRPADDQDGPDFIVITGADLFGHIRRHEPADKAALKGKYWAAMAVLQELREDDQDIAMALDCHNNEALARYVLMLDSSITGCCGSQFCRRDQAIKRVRREMGLDPTTTAHRVLEVFENDEAVEALHQLLVSALNDALPSAEQQAEVITAAVVKAMTRVLLAQNLTGRSITEAVAEGVGTALARQGVTSWQMTEKIKHDREAWWASLLPVKIGRGFTSAVRWTVDALIWMVRYTIFFGALGLFAYLVLAAMPESAGSQVLYMLAIGVWTCLAVLTAMVIRHKDIRILVLEFIEQDIWGRFVLRPVEFFREVRVGWNNAEATRTGPWMRSYRIGAGLYRLLHRSKPAVPVAEVPVEPVAEVATAPQIREIDDGVFLTTTQTGGGDDINVAEH